MWKVKNSGKNTYRKYEGLTRSGKIFIFIIESIFGSFARIGEMENFGSGKSQLSNRKKILLKTPPEFSKKKFAPRFLPHHFHRFTSNHSKK